MKVNTILFVVGSVFAIGAISYGVYNKFANHIDGFTQSTNAHTDDTDHFENSSSDDNSYQRESDGVNQKQQAAQSIYDRHNEAGSFFNKTVNNIVNDNNCTNVESTKNSAKIDKSSKDLDDLLN